MIFNPSVKPYFWRKSVHFVFWLKISIFMPKLFLGILWSFRHFTDNFMIFAIFSYHIFIELILSKTHTHQINLFFEENQEN